MPSRTDIGETGSANAVVKVSTAVPAFVGHTAVATDARASLAGRPWRIASLDEYRTHFGAAPVPLFDIVTNAGAASEASFDAGGQGYLLTQAGGPAGGRFLLYYSLLHFFQNGGGPCYIVSVGGYDAEVSADALRGGIDSLVHEQEPTLLVVPDAVLLEEADCAAVQQAMLSHCGSTRRRMAILDIRDGWRSQGDSGCVDHFRQSLGAEDLAFGAAYYPWVNTTLVQDGELNFENIAPASRALLLDLIQPGLAAVDQVALDSPLAAASPLFDAIVTAMKRHINLLPASAAMAGIYTTVDNTHGVWKSPANVAMNGVLSPAVEISQADQADLDVDVQGRSVNAIRAFPGEGVLVWGARTLDGNSLDWRDINVRRTMIMIEESCRLAAKAVVFEPNVAATWNTVKAMLGNYLTGIWKRGGLVGKAPAEAFSVHVGLGETMTGEDVLEGILRVTVLVALVRPAEFIEIAFQQIQSG